MPRVFPSVLHEAVCRDDKAKDSVREVVIRDFQLSAVKSAAMTHVLMRRNFLGFHGT